MAFEIHPDLARDSVVIGQFDLCQLRLINDSTYPWYVLIPQRENIRDTIDLKPHDYTSLWDESRVLSVALMQAYQGEKLNVASLGNVTPQLHLHHVIRFSADPAWPGPIWGKLPLQPYTETEFQSARRLLVAANMTGFRPAAPNSV